MRGGVGKNSKSVWWNDEVKAAVERKETAWKEVMRAGDEAAKERYMKTFKVKMRNVKNLHIRAKRR